MVSSSSSLSAHNVSPGDPAVLQKKNASLSLSVASPENAKNSCLDIGTIKEALEKAEEVARTFERGLHFQFREEAGRYQVEVLDLNDDNRVIRKIPPDDIVNFIAHVREMFGAMLDVSV